MTAQMSSHPKHPHVAFLGAGRHALFQLCLLRWADWQLQSADPRVNPKCYTTEKGDGNQFKWPSCSPYASPTTSTDAKAWFVKNVQAAQGVSFDFALSLVDLRAHFAVL
jgi:hypothetical protein